MNEQLVCEPLLGFELYSRDWKLAFIAIGHVASAVGSDMKSFLESIMYHVKLGLQMRGFVVFPLHSTFYQT